MLANNICDALHVIAFICTHGYEPNSGNRQHCEDYINSELVALDARKAASQSLVRP